jgi:hypothetical protein
MKLVRRARQEELRSLPTNNWGTDDRAACRAYRRAVRDGTRLSRMPLQPVHPSHNAFPGVVLGYMEMSEKDWRLPSGLNKLRISGDIAQFVVILRKLAAVSRNKRAASLRRDMELPDV